MSSTRRHWLSTCIAAASWPEVLRALDHAHASLQSSSRHFEVLDASAASDLTVLVEQILPSTDGPGAREAGVIYFIDRALASFAADGREAYSIGLAEVRKQRINLFPGSSSIAALSDEQQKQLLQAIETTEFFDLLRTHTVLGFLGDPSYGGNRDGVGWQQIGFDYHMHYQPPFGFYDAQSNGKDGPGPRNGERQQ